MKTLLSVLLLVLSISLYSQEKTNNFGVQAGVIAPYYHGGDIKYSGIKDAVAGLSAGAYYRHLFNQSLGLGIQGLYNAGGAYNTPERIIFKPHYVSLPATLIIKYRSFSVEGGGYLAKLVSASNTDGFGYKIKWKVKNWDYYQSWDYGAYYGFGFYLNRVRISYYGSYGLANVRTKESLKKYGTARLINTKNISNGFRLLFDLN